MLLSYQWRNLLILGLMLAASGAVVRISRCPIYLPRRLGRLPVWQPLAVAVLVADLFLFGAGFNPSADPAQLDFTPPAIQFLQQRVAEEEPWRLTTYQVQTPDSTKTLNANIPWLKGLQDIRGYDSIIPRQYVEYMAAIEPQGELLYNRIAPIYGAGEPQLAAARSAERPLRGNRGGDPQPGLSGSSTTTRCASTRTSTCCPAPLPCPGQSGSRLRICRPGWTTWIRVRWCCWTASNGPQGHRIRGPTGRCSLPRSSATRPTPCS